MRRDSSKGTVSSSSSGKSDSGQDSASSRISAPAVSAPEGGGAFRGLGESFETQDFTGSASFSIPIPCPEARGLTPQPLLTYSSGGGNGVFGLGFSLTLSSIGRKTSNGIPRYTGEDSFILSDYEELVPALKWDSGEWIPEKRIEQKDGSSWEVQAWRPRLEAAFDRIEHWTSLDAVDSFWRVLTRDNVTHYYGKSSEARIFAPDDPRCVFQWLIEETVDALGNRIRYRYKSDDGINLKPEIFEAGRDLRSNRYISTIEYGNYFTGAVEHFAFRVVFDYGEFDINDPDAPPGAWTVRPDPFSSYRSGFEIRTSRRCSNILIYHCFHDQFDGQPFLTRVLRLRYRNSCELSASWQAAPSISFVESITEIGFRKESDGSYSRKELPALELNYSMFNPAGQKYEKLQVDGDLTVPGYLAGGQYLSVDLQGEGLPGLLYSDGTTTLEWEPLGDGRYAAPHTPLEFPIASNLDNPEIAITSLEGNGQPDLVVRASGRSGFYSFSGGEPAWDAFQPFVSTPVDIANPDGDMVDMDGDGRADLLVFQMSQIRSYPSMGELGFGPADIEEKRPDFPSSMQAGDAEVLTFADMFGDGLSHRVRIRNGLVECWPNLGYGRFGAKVTLGNAPDFGAGFDARRLQLADLDGSGPTDLIYVNQDSIQVFFNRSGNSFSEPLTIALPEPYDDLSQVTFGDIRGNGTSCLILTRLSPDIVHYYYDFAGDLKPYLLTDIDNHVGATTRIHYTTSVQQYLEDKRAGRKWATRLYFPVQVVAKVEHFDAVCRTRHATKHKYHDGYYDPVEREFRGFGYVETWDSEEFEEFVTASSATQFLSPPDINSYVPPAYIRTWFHTGAFLDASTISSQYRQEYWNGDPGACLLPENTFDKAIYEQDQETVRQAYAALAGQVLRREVFGLDHSPAEANPYTVAESTVMVRLVQPRFAGRYAVFLTYPLEGLESQYERDPSDPRIKHNFSLLVDEFGNLRRTCAVAYARRRNQGVTVYPGQDALKIVVSEKLFIDHVETGAEPYRWIGVECENRDYELTGLTSSGYFTLDALAKQVDEAFLHQIPYGRPFLPGARQARLFLWSQTFYWDEAQSSALSLKHISSRGLQHHIQDAVLTPELAETVLEGKLTPTQLSNDAGYFLDQDYWWNRGLIRHYFKSPERFFLPCQVDGAFPKVDPLSPINPTTTVAYDAYFLLQTKTTEYVEGLPDSTIPSVVLTTMAENDYQSLQPDKVTDPNGNQTEILFDPLGLVSVMTIFGTEAGVPVGDDPLSSYQPVANAGFTEVVDHPHKYLQKATAFFYYDFKAWADRQQPSSTIALLRHTHVHNLAPGFESQIQVRIVFTDGFGRVIESKMKTDAELAKPGAVADVSLQRWIVSERTIYNNKDEPAKQYLPWFSLTPDYESQAQIDRENLAPPTVFHYDPLDRLIRTDTPKGFFTKAEFLAWEVKNYDQDDTVKDSEFYRNFFSHPIPPDRENERDALDKAAAFFNTPSLSVLDNMGRTIRRLDNNLGAVRPATFDKIVEGHPITPQELWDQLVALGYLRPDAKDPTEAWVTSQLQPYEAAFQQLFKEQFANLAAPILDLLKNNGLTTVFELDIAGNELRSADPRLFYSNVTKQTEYHNFIFVRDMMGNALSSHGADTGLVLTLDDIFDSPFWSFSARNFEQFIFNDRLQRRSHIRVNGFTNDGLLVSDNLVETFLYGESQPDGETFNLRGELYELHDQSGVLRNPRYSFQGDVQESERRFSVDYKGVLNWAGAVDLEKDCFKTQFSFNALRLPVTRTLPDNSTIGFKYNLAGLVNEVEVTYHDGTRQAIVERVLYNANDQPLSLFRANGVITNYGYEDTTLRLLTLFSSRSTENLAGNARDGVLQNILYTYDPVGNITRTVDSTYQTIFYNNQAVSPLSDYTYDPIYRLIKANGRQHPGITAVTYRNNQKDGDFKQSKYYALPSDAAALETYIEKYGYDDAGNLLVTKHSASTPWTRSQEIMPDSNHLKQIHASNGISYSFPVSYDKSGNQTRLDINNPVRLYWNCCENLVSARIIERPDQLDDSDYYNYDSQENRTRRVSERMANGGSVTEKEVTLYLGDYEVSLLKKETAASDEPILERRTVRVVSDELCLAMIDYLELDLLKRGVSQTGTKTVRHQLDTQLDSVALEVDGDAQLISYEEYFPYGGTAFIAGRAQQEVSLKVYRYSGKLCDDSTGLYYYGARYYAPWLGRWLQPDPLGTIDGLNLYAFTLGNPIINIDVGGTSKKKLRHADMNKRSKDVGTMIAKETKKGKGLTKKQIDKMHKEVQGVKRKFDVSVQSDEIVEEALDSAMSGDKGKAAKKYRAAEKGMDEFTSTATVTNMGEGIGSVTLSEGQTAQITSAVQLLSEARLPTSQVGYSLSSGDTIQHPTSASGALWGSSGKNHGRMDLERRDNVLTATESSTNQGVGRLFTAMTTSMEYTLNEVAAPPFASTITTKSGVTKKQREEAHKHREAQKEIFWIVTGEKKPKKKQKRNAAWKPNPSRRGVSPPRELN